MPEKKSIKAWSRESGISEKTGNNYFWYFQNEVGIKFQVTPKGYRLSAEEWKQIMEYARERKRNRRRRSV
jgi:hypothetical protein